MKRLLFLILLALVSLSLLIIVIYRHLPPRDFKTLVSLFDATQTSLLQVGTNIWIGYEPFYLARNLEFFSPNEIRLVEFSSATQVIRAFRNNIIQAAALTVDETLDILNLGIKGKIVLILDYSSGSDVVLAHPHIKTSAALKGKRLGVEKSSLGEYMLVRFLQVNGFSRQDLTIVPLEVNKHKDAFEKHRVDAVITFEPFASQLIKTHKAITIFDSRQIPGEIIDVLFVRDDALEVYESHFVKLIAGWYQALNFLKINPEQAHVIMAKRMQVEKTEMYSMLTGVEFPTIYQSKMLLAQNNSTLYRTMQQIKSIMLSSQLIKEFPIDGIFSTEFITKLLSQGRLIHE